MLFRSATISRVAFLGMITATSFSERVKTNGHTNIAAAMINTSSASRVHFINDLFLCDRVPALARERFILSFLPPGFAGRLDALLSGVIYKV